MEVAGGHGSVVRHDIPMSFWLVMRTSDGNERPFAVRESRTVIGRESRCDVRIAVPSVADRHCEIVLDGSHLTLKDLDSDGGTFVNGQRVRDARLGHADQLRIGPVTFEVRVSDQAGAVPPRGAPELRSPGMEMEVGPELTQPACRAQQNTPIEARADRTTDPRDSGGI